MNEWMTEGMNEWIKRWIQLKIDFVWCGQRTQNE